VSTPTRFSGMVQTIFFDTHIVTNNGERNIPINSSSVGIATDYGLDDWMIGVQFLVGAVIFSLRHCVQTGSGAHPASYLMGTGALSLGVKRPGREADHSPPCSTDVKNEWSYTSISQYVFMAWCLVKHRDNSTFTLPCYIMTLFHLHRLLNFRWNGSELNFV
jgi:hypothetical protein